MRKKYQETREEMDDCNIPVTIKMRASELQKLSDKLRRLEQEFTSLKQADRDQTHQNTRESGEEITELMNDIKVKLSKLDQTRNELIQYQKQKLESYEYSDFQGVNAHIIAEIRDFKGRIS